MSSSSSPNNPSSYASALVNGISEHYSSLFPIYKEADLVVRSKDGILFATEKLHLRSASSVLYDVLGLGSEEGEKRDGRSLLRLEEEGEVLEPFLRLIQRDKFRIDGEDLELDFKLVMALSPALEKYATSPQVSLLFGRYLLFLVPLAGQTPPPATRCISLFALAVIHEDRTVAKVALRSLHNWHTAEEEASVFTHHDAANSKAMSNDWRHAGIEDIPLELLERMPMSVVKQFSLLHRKVSSRGEFSWSKAANEFKVS